MDNPFVRQTYTFIVRILQRTIRLCQANAIGLIKNFPLRKGAFKKFLKSMILYVKHQAITHGFGGTAKKSLAFSNSKY
jgi:hypothetical protein